MMRSLLLILMFCLSLSAVAQFNGRRNVSYKKTQTVDYINTFNIANTDLIYRVARMPIYTLSRSGNSGTGYWQGLAVKEISPDKFFESTYHYDTQGNLRETRSYFNIKRKGQLTKWSILIPTYGGSPAFIHTLK
jgi:hypothetical protein